MDAIPERDWQYHAHSGRPEHEVRGALLSGALLEKALTGGRVFDIIFLSRRLFIAGGGHK
jgi:hypothetical protein